MTCSEVRELLSAYFDRELDGTRHRFVSDHLDRCDDCRTELESFQELSERTHSLADPVPPAHLWEEIEAKLEPRSIPAAAPSPSGVGSSWYSKGRPWVVGLAASFALLVLGWFLYRSWFGNHAHNELTEDFSRYTTLSEKDPRVAHQFLVEKYSGKPATLEVATEAMGHRPRVLGSLPEGYTMVSSHVLDMPCCRCVACLCVRPDGTSFGLFEHEGNQTHEWFEDRPVVSAQCDGQACKLVQLNGTLAVSWKDDRSHITMIGVRDVTEFSEFVRQFTEKR